MLHPETKQMMPATSSFGSIREGNLMTKPIIIINIPSNSSTFAA
ncbi:MAG: hypothetical protein ACKVHA_07165 [Fidelibacterota bacterium]